LRKLRGTLCCLLALLLLGIAPGCGSDPPQPGQSASSVAASGGIPAASASGSLTLPFAKRDVLNPFLAVSQLNRQLSPLLYESLFAPDESYAAQPVLALAAQEQTALQWTVTLRGDRKFHNGAAVTAQDVVYSFQKAKTSANYRERLAHVTGVTAQKDGSLRVTLNRANAFLPACLDFPVVPNGSAEGKKLETAQNGYLFNAAATPPGTGAYRLQENDDGFYFSYDRSHPGRVPSILTIRLFGVNDTKSLLYGLEMGNYQFAYDDLSGGELPRVSAATAHVPSLNLVYLGFQQSRAPLGDAELRSAIAACINKTALAGEAFRGYMRTTDTPFPPEWKSVDAKDFAQPFDAAAAKQRLETAGFQKVNKQGVRVSAGGRELRFTLLVNKDNGFKLAAARLLQAQCRELQIVLELKALPLKEYNAAVAAKSFDLYLGELRLPPDCSLEALLLSGGAASAGINVWGKSASAYGQMTQGLLTPAQFVAAFQEDMPFVPLGYRDGLVAYARGITLQARFRQERLFEGIEDWQS
jgi:ABC-type transport system substrate-binding protein